MLTQAYNGVLITHVLPVVAHWQEQTVNREMERETWDDQHRSVLALLLHGNREGENEQARYRDNK